MQRINRDFYFCRGFRDGVVVQSAKFMSDVVDHFLVPKVEGDALQSDPKGDLRRECWGDYRFPSLEHNHPVIGEARRSSDEVGEEPGV